MNSIKLRWQRIDIFIPHLFQIWVFHILLQVFFSHLIIALPLFTLISRVKEKVIALSVIISGFFEAVPVKGHLRLVMKVIREEPLLKLWLLFVEIRVYHMPLVRVKRNIGNPTDYSVLVL